MQKVGSLPRCLEKRERVGYSYVKPTVIRPPLKASLCFTTTYPSERTGGEGSCFPTFAIQNYAPYSASAQIDLILDLRSLVNVYGRSGKRRF